MDDTTNDGRVAEPIPVDLTPSTVEALRRLGLVES